MGNVWLIACLCLCAGWLVGLWTGPMFGGTSIWTEADASGRDPVAMPTLHPIVERVAPGVVGVIVSLTPEAALELAASSGSQVDGRGEPPSSVVEGTGFVVHPDGIVVTSRHLVQGAAMLDVVVKGSRKRAAVVIGEDPLTDIAVLRIASPPDELTHLELGTSESLRQGDWVVTISNPRGYTQSVTPGLVSYIGRHLSRHDMRVTGDFIQFSAPVNPGSSGGPLVDMRGHVVGVVAQSAAGAEGISFAVPVETLKWVLDEIGRSQDGLVRRGFIGIRFDSRSTDGVLISGIEPGQPGDRAGLEAGDVVLDYDGERIEDAAQLHQKVTTSRPGQRVHLRIKRGPDMLELDVVLGEATHDAAAEETEAVDQ